MKLRITARALGLIALSHCFPSVLALPVPRSSLYYLEGGDLTPNMPVTSTFHYNDQLTAQTNPKDVGYLLATTVKDEDAVLFTKSSLIQFLKSHDIQVDTNYSELKGLPKYATFGKLDKSTCSLDDESGPVSDRLANQQTYRDPQPRNADGTSEPIEQVEHEDQNHRGIAPPSVPSPIHARGQPQQSDPLRTNTAQEQNQEEHKSHLIATFKGVGGSQDDRFRPTRRVREAIGGGSEQVASLFSGQDEQENKPPKRK